MGKLRPRGPVFGADVAVVALLLGGCSAVGDVLGGGEDVLDTGIEPVILTFDGPAYLAPDGRRGLVVRDGAHEQRLDRATALGWLPDGNALVIADGRVRLVNPAVGITGGDFPYWHDPGQVTSLVGWAHRGRDDEFVLRQYDLSLRRVHRYDLPVTDNPDAGPGVDLYRNYYGAIPTIDGITFVKWHDGSETYEDGDYGVLRIDAEGGMSNVQVNDNVVGHYLSADGTGLLGLRQVSGTPCGGCRVEQDVVEIDPGTGEIGAEYGMPAPYDEDWRVAGMDKVGDRVAVRFYEPLQQPDGGFAYAQRGTWVYDGEWEMLPGSDEELTWWQGEDRVVARVDPTETRRGDGFDLVWIRDGQETPLDVELSRTPVGVPATGDVAGQYLPPG